MKDLILLILQYVPQYLNDLGSLLYRPKRFIAAKNPQADETFVAALVFLVISLIISQIMVAPLQPPQKDVWSAVAGIAAVSVVVIFISAVTLRVAWGLVGGKASTKSLFTVSVYYNAAWFIIINVLSLIIIGAFKVIDPKLAEASKKMTFNEAFKVGANQQISSWD